MFGIFYRLLKSSCATQTMDINTDRLSDFIDTYEPTAVLMFYNRCSSIHLDVNRDMHGIHSDLLDIVEALMCLGPGFGPYTEHEDTAHESDVIYSMLLRETHFPKYLFIIRNNDLVNIYTKTLVADGIKATYDDLTMSDEPVIEFVQTCVGFLRIYIGGLVDCFPQILGTPEYTKYIERLDAI